MVHRVSINKLFSINGTDFSDQNTSTQKNTISEIKWLFFTNFWSVKIPSPTTKEKKRIGWVPKSKRLGPFLTFIVFRIEREDTGSSSTKPKQQPIFDFTIRYDEKAFSKVTKMEEEQIKAEHRFVLKKNSNW